MRSCWAASARPWPTGRSRPRRVLPPTPPAPADPVALFAERAGEYRAAVHRVDQAGVAALVAEICAAHGARRLAVPQDLPEAWLPPGVEATGDATVSALDRVDGVLTGCAAAIAETGTIVLDGGPGQGIRALTLVPDLHICVVPAELVCASVSEAFQRVEPSVRRAPRAADADLGAVRHLRHRAVAGRGRARPPPAGDRDRGLG